MYQRFQRNGKSKGWFYRYKDPVTGRWKEKKGGNTRAACKTQEGRVIAKIASGQGLYGIVNPERFEDFANADNRSRKLVSW